MKIQNRKFIPAMFAWLLIAAMLLVSLPLCVSAEGTQDREPSLKDSLFIHYDFKGDTLEEKLADKAGGVKSNLSVIGNEAVSLNEDGTVANAITDEAVATEKGVKFDESGTGSVTASKANSFALTTGKTADTAAIHDPDAPTNMTWYLRVKVSGNSGWLILMSMRTSDNRVMHIEGTGNRIKANVGSTFPSGDITGNSNVLWSNQWHEIAVVRTAAATAEGKDHYALYTSRNVVSDNPNGEWYLAAEADHDKVHGAVDSSALVMSLFAIVNGSYSGVNQDYITYDDVRVYNKALTVDEMKEVHNEVVGGASLEDSLFIHYDFKGATLQEKLADKAGAVNTNLSIIGAGAVELDTDGSVKYAITNEEAAGNIGVVFDESGTGSVTASSASSFALTTGITADTTAMHVSSTPTDMTWYLRVKVSASSGWLILLSMRTGDNRVMHIEGTENRIKANIGSALPNGDVADGSNNLWSNQWHEIALVRTAATTAAGKDHYALYTSRNVASDNPNGEWYLAAEADHTYTHESMSAEELVMSLFANVQMGYEGIGQNLLTYDDVRVYSKALSVEEMKEVHGEVVGAATPMPADSEVEIYGAQRSLNNTEKNTYSIRLLAQIKEGCTAAGFYVTPSGYNQQKIGVSVAYTSILAGAENGTLQEIKAAEGHYLIAITISDIPVSVDEIAFTVTPYIVKDETETTGRTVIFALKDALIQSATWVD